MNEQEEVEAAIGEELRVCVAAGVVSDKLAELVHALAAIRVCSQLAEDLAQTVLLGLVRRLPTIRADADAGYIGMAIVNGWRKAMRRHNSEVRFLRRTAGRLLDDVPTNERETAARQAQASAGRLFYGKYLT